MRRLLLSLAALWALLLIGVRYTCAGDDDDSLKGALIEKFVLPVLKEKVTALDKSSPSEIHYGLKGNSVGRNGLREEIENHDIVRDGKKVNETRYNYFDKFGWAEKGGTWGPPGFQYYIFRDPLNLAFDPKNLEFTLSTKLEFKIAVAINYDTGFLGIKPWVFATTGFGDQWPNVVDISIKSKVAFEKDGKFTTKTTTHVNSKKTIVLETLHGLVKRDCSPEVVELLKKEMDKIAGKFDEEVKKSQVKLGK